VVRRLLRLVPVGTFAVGGGLAVLGLASYVYLAIAGHALDAAGFASVSVLVSLVLSIGLGLFFPVEQEVTRLVSGRRAAGQGAWPVFTRGVLLAAGLLVVFLAILAAVAGPVGDHLFRGDAGMVLALAGAFAGAACSYATRGLLAGGGHFGRYGAQLGIDGGLRIVGAAALAGAGVRSAVAFGLVLFVAPVLSVLATVVPPVLAARRAAAAPGPAAPLPWRVFLHGIGFLMVTTVMTQLLVNVGAVNAQLLSTGDAALTGALVSAMMLARLPLFVFQSMQASLLPSLSAAISVGDHAAYRRMLVRISAVVTALGVTGGALLSFLGPRLAPVVFGVAPVLGVPDYAWLAVGTVGYMFALVVGQGVLSTGHHRQLALGWVVGVAVLFAVTVAAGTVRLRVELGFALGSATVAVLLAVLLVRAMRHRTPPVASDTPLDGLAHTGGEIR
jgi:O-antigen/teichoic acid export membrane protein